MNLHLRQAERKQAKIKIGLQGPSGSGKTMSSLLLAKGLVGNFSKIACIDSENSSCDLYAHLGSYNVLVLKPPYACEQYIKAIQLCEESGMECIIIDSLTHAYEHLLDYHASLSGHSSFQNWSKVTPRWRALVDCILQTTMHVVCCSRTKQDYVLNNKQGKFVPEKVGLKAVHKEGFDFEMSIVFDIDIKHFAVASKDRTGLFADKPEFTLSEQTGEMIRNWCETGTDISAVKAKINQATTLQELKILYNQYSSWKDLLHPYFVKRKSALQVQIKTTKPIQNGIKNS